MTYHNEVDKIDGLLTEYIKTPCVNEVNGDKPLTNCLATYEETPKVLPTLVKCETNVVALTKEDVNNVIMKPTIQVLIDKKEDVDVVFVEQPKHTVKVLIDKKEDVNVVFVDQPKHTVQVLIDSKEESKPIHAIVKQFKPYPRKKTPPIQKITDVNDSVNTLNIRQPEHIEVLKVLANTGPSPLIQSPPPIFRRLRKIKRPEPVNEILKPPPANSTDL
jgi:hypothetical protein